MIPSLFSSYNQIVENLSKVNFHFFIIERQFLEIGILEIVPTKKGGGGSWLGEGVTQPS